MATQTTTTTEETVVPSGPSMVPPEIPPWNPPSGSRLERRRSFEVQSPRPEHINPLPPSSDPFVFFGSSGRQQEERLRIHRGRSPTTPTPSAGRLGRQTRTPICSASEPSADGNDDEGGDNRGSRGGGNPPSPPNPPDPPGPPGPPGPPPRPPRRIINITPNPPPTGAANKERGNRPDAFTKKSQLENFQLQLVLFFSQNNHLYPNDADKILFALSLCTEGAPTQFAKLALLQASKNRGRWGTFNSFMTKLEQTFGDPNEDRNEFVQLEKLKMKDNESADEYFQRFEMVANRANALANNDRQIIHLIEKQIHQELIHRVYAKDNVPTNYEDYKKAVIVADTLEWQFKAIAKDHPASYQKEASTSASKKKRTKNSGGEAKKKLFFFVRPKAAQTNAQQTDMSKSKPEDKCFLCGKAGHWKKDCPNPKKSLQLRAQYQSLTDAEKEEFAEASF